MKRNPKSLSVIIPAYNEEERIQSALESVLFALTQLQLDYEIIPVNDGSRDRTQEIIEQWSAQHPGVPLRLINNSPNKGLGASILEGFKAAKKDYVAWFPGDSSVTKESLIGMWSSVGQADMVLPYMENVLKRNFKRKYCSLIYVHTLNFIFGLNIKYYNGLFIIPAALAKETKLFSRGHELFCELVVRAVKSGYTYKQVPFTHKVSTDQASKAINMRNVKNIARIICILIADVYIRKTPMRK